MIEVLNDKNFKQKYTNRVIPFYLAWHLDVASGAFQFIGNTSNFEQLNIASVEQLVKRVHPCFLDYYNQILNVFLKNTRSFFSGISESINIQLLLPIELNTGYTMFKQVLVPHFENNKTKELIIINDPITKYNKEAFVVEVYVSGKYNKELTYKLKEQFKKPIEFSKCQKRIVDLISKGMTSTEIANYLERSVPAVYKMNRKVLEKISEYYKIEFNNVKEAILFHYKNFVLE